MVIMATNHHNLFFFDGVYKMMNIINPLLVQDVVQVFVEADLTTNKKYPVKAGYSITTKQATD